MAAGIEAEGAEAIAQAFETQVVALVIDRKGEIIKDVLFVQFGAALVPCPG